METSDQVNNNIDKIKNEIINTEIKIIQSKKTKDYTCELQNKDMKRIILSKYDPRDAAKLLVENQQNINKNTIWVTFGYGFGYIAESIIKRVGRDANILVIEPNSKFLKKQWEYGWEKFADFENIQYITDETLNNLENIVEKSFKYFELTNINLITINAYREIYKENYFYYINFLEEFRARKIINQNTLQRFSILMIKNLFNNAKYMIEGYDIKQHKNKYSTIPAVIVSAGPSLNKNIQQLKDFNGIIFALGRTTTIINKYNVKPDFIVSLDPTDLVYETFMESKHMEVPLITTSEGNNLVVKNHKGIKYFLRSSELDRTVLGIENMEKVEMGGSVANFSASIAKYMGCNPIVFIGQDLAYTNNDMHAEGCRMSEDKKNNKKNQKSIKIVEGYNGDKVQTDLTLLGYLRWFENFIVENPDLEVINATEGGAKIKGATQLAFKEVIERFKSNKKIIINHEEYDWLNKLDITENIKISIEQLKQVCLLLHRGENLSSKLLDEYLIYKGIRSNKINTILERIDSEVEKEIFSIKDSGCMKYIFEAVGNEVVMKEEYKEAIEENLLKRSIRIAKMNHEVYQKLEIECNKLLDELGGDSNAK